MTRYNLAGERKFADELYYRYVLNLPVSSMRRLSVAWLLLALGSLVGGGLLTIVVVLSRTPYVQDFFPWVDMFHTALVVHVDLTVLVWFLSMAGVFWCLNSTASVVALGWAAWGFCLLGASIITLSPFLGAANPMMTNYIPILYDPIFLTGLGIFGLGFLLQVLRSTFWSRSMGKIISGQGALRFGLYCSLLAAIVSIAALGASYFGLPDTHEVKHYFELLFWGGGHTLQFVHIQLMLVAWLWLATVSGITSRLTPRIVVVLFVIGLVPVFLTPLVYLSFPVDSPDHLHSMTWLMQFGGGLAAVPISLVIMFNLLGTLHDRQRNVAERSALFSSMILFGLGGVIGFMIDGSNVTVPAHYHGSIVAVTLAYMGVTYHILPLLGFRVAMGRMTIAQPWFYGGGQILHVVGLAWSGGYGVQRKTAGEAQLLDGIEKIAGMGLMGLGGLISVVGGLLFLVIVLRSMLPQNRIREIVVQYH